MDNVLSIKDLCKDYGKFHVLKGVTLDIPKESIFGLVGRNGAGKTTLMRIITGLAEPTSGTYSIGGISSKNKKILTVRRRMGSIIESPAIYKNLNAYDNVKLQYINLGMTSFDSIPELLELVDLQGTGRKKAGKFSLGMRQRLGIAVALCGNPDILVLDEPINGLDPQGIIEMRDIIHQVNRDQHITVLISSHILEELSKIATHYGIIHEGRLIEQLSSEELMDKCAAKLVIVTDAPEKACTVLDTLGGIEYKVADKQTIYLSNHLDDAAAINMALCGAGVAVQAIGKKNESLEDYFVGLIHKA